MGQPMMQNAPKTVQKDGRFDDRPTWPTAYRVRLEEALSRMIGLVERLKSALEFTGLPGSWSSTRTVRKADGRAVTEQ